MVPRHAFLESPYTFWADFEHNNSHCILLDISKHETWLEVKYFLSLQIC